MLPGNSASQVDVSQQKPNEDKSGLWRLAEQPSFDVSAPDYETLRQVLGASVCRRLGIFELPPGFVLSVVIPVYNELRTIEEVVRRVRGTGLPIEMVLVDDGSVDGTRDILSEWRNQPDMKIIFHAHNQGKGAALRTGFAAATGTVVIVQDADLEYDPAEFVKLIQPIVENQADVVFGSRFAGDNQRVLYFWHYVGNRVLTLLSNMMTNLNLSDMETCYKAFRREIIQKIAPTLRKNRFGIEPELTAKIASIKNVPHSRAADQLRGPHVRRGQEDHLARRVPRPLLHRSLLAWHWRISFRAAFLPARLRADRHSRPSNVSLREPQSRVYHHAHRIKMAWIGSRAR